MFAQLSSLRWVVAVALGALSLATIYAVTRHYMTNPGDAKEGHGCEYVRKVFELAFLSDEDVSVSAIRSAIRSISNDPTSSITVSDRDFLRYTEIRKSWVTALDNMSPPEELKNFHDDFKIATIEMRDHAVHAQRLAMTGELRAALKAIGEAER